MQTDAVCRGRPGHPESGELWHICSVTSGSRQETGKINRIKEQGRRIIPPRSAEPPTYVLMLSRGRPEPRPRAANEWSSSQSHGNRGPRDRRRRTSRIFFLVMMRAAEAPNKLGSSGSERINSMLATGAASRPWSRRRAGFSYRFRSCPQANARG